MSGGVDSAVTALLLKEQGHDVFAICMKLYDEGSSRCCGVSDIRDARLVAAELDIPFYVLDYREEFRRLVLHPFLDGYLAGRTPIPCLPCNRLLKFAGLQRDALEMGARLVATGHYARIEEKGAKLKLLRGMERVRDQSYYLYQLGQEELSRLLFPLGEMAKDEVRQIAALRGLSVSEKPDSQEICFVPSSGYAAFIEGRRPVAPGPILDLEGRRLGTHGGIHRYTVGQRRGLGISAKEPLYVVSIDADRQSVTVGAASTLAVTALRPEAVSFVAGCEHALPLSCEVSVRANHPATAALLRRDAEGLEVRFEKPVRGVSPGQAAVFYVGDEVLGGGIIAKTESSATR